MKQGLIIVHQCACTIQLAHLRDRLHQLIIQIMRTEREREAIIIIINTLILVAMDMQG